MRGEVLSFGGLPVLLGELLALSQSDWRRRREAPVRRSWRAPDFDQGTLSRSAQRPHAPIPGRRLGHDDGRRRRSLRQGFDDSDTFGSQRAQLIECSAHGRGHDVTAADQRRRPGGLMLRCADSRAAFPAVSAS
jgi:hypothetical protein